MERIVYFDLLKFVAIYFICFGHSLIAVSDKDALYDNILFNHLVSIQMPVFMAIMGYFSHSSFKRPLWVFLKDKARQFILPLLVCNIVWRCWLFLIGKDNLWGDVFSWSYFLWFLSCAFVCFVIAWVSLKLFRNAYCAALVSLLFVICNRYFNVCYINSLFIFFWTGYFYKKKEPSDRITLKWLFVICTIGYLSLSVKWNFGFSMYAIPVQFVSFHAFDFVNFCQILYRYLIGFMGSLAIMSFGKLISPWIQNNSVVSRISLIGQNTLGIYIMQKFFLEILFMYIGIHLKSQSLIYLFAFILSVIELVFCNYLVLLHKKYPILNRLLLGGK